MNASFPREDEKGQNMAPGDSFTRGLFYKVIPILPHHL